MFFVSPKVIIISKRSEHLNFLYVMMALPWFLNIFTISNNEPKFLSGTSVPSHDDSTFE